MQKILVNISSKKPTSCFLQDAIQLGVSVREGHNLHVYKSGDITAFYTFNSATSVEITAETRQRLSEEVIDNNLSIFNNQISRGGLPYPCHFNWKGMNFYNGMGFGMPLNVVPVFSGKAGDCIARVFQGNIGKQRLDPESLCIVTGNGWFSFFEGDYFDIWCGTLGKEIVKKAFSKSNNKFDETFIFEALNMSYDDSNIRPLLFCLPNNQFVTSTAKDYFDSLVSERIM